MWRGPFYISCIIPLGVRNSDESKRWGEGLSGSLSPGGTLDQGGPGAGQGFGPYRARGSPVKLGVFLRLRGQMIKDNKSLGLLFVTGSPSYNCLCQGQSYNFLGIQGYLWWKWATVSWALARLLAGSQVFSEARYPFHLIRYWIPFLLGESRDWRMVSTS